MADTSSYSSPADGKKKLIEYRDSWTSALGDRSQKACYAIIGAAWAMYGTTGNLLRAPFATMAVLFALLSVSLNLFDVHKMVVLLTDRVRQANQSAESWAKEFDGREKPESPWPFTDEIQGQADGYHRAQFWIPVLGFLLLGVDLLRGLVQHLF